MQNLLLFFSLSFYKSQEIKIVTSIFTIDFLSSTEETQDTIVKQQSNHEKGEETEQLEKS